MGYSEWNNENSDQPPQLARGQAEHAQFQADILENEDRVEGHDTFTTEKGITDIEGNVVRNASGGFGKPDYVDYEENFIIDLKPIHEGETDEDVYAKYQDQLDSYAELYEDGRGVTPTVGLTFYDA